MGSRIYLLIKVFDKEEYADAFIQRGELFCRTLREFKLLEDVDGRGDKYEAVTNWHQPDRVALTLTYTDTDGVEKTMPIEKLAGPVIIQNNGHDGLNIYCMYSVNIPEFEEYFETEEERVIAAEKINTLLKESSRISDDFFSLGEFAVIVYNVEAFIDMVKKAAEQREFDLAYGLVDYYDPDTFHGDFEHIEAVFKKRNIYKHQNEFRFAFGSTEPEGNKVIHLGSMDGIAIKVASKDIKDGLQIKLNE